MIVDFIFSATCSTYSLGQPLRVNISFWRRQVTPHFPWLWGDQAEDAIREAGGVELTKILDGRLACNSGQSWTLSLQKIRLILLEVYPKLIIN